MFTSDIVFSSTSGSAPIVRKGPPTIVESEGAARLKAAPPSERITIPAPPLNPGMSSVLEKIFEIVASISAEKGRSIGLAALEEYARNGGDAGTRQLAENARAAAMTKESLVAEMQSGNWLRTGDRGKRAENIAMVDAMKNGSANVLDLEETGLKSTGTYTAHFTEKGEFAGKSAEIAADFEAISRFQDENIIRHADGSMTDRKTGLNANFIQEGHKFLYITWPDPVPA